MGRLFSPPPFSLRIPFLAGLLVLVFSFFLLLESRFPLLRTAWLLLSSKGFSYSADRLDQYLALAASKEARRTLIALRNHRAFSFQNEDLSFYILLAHLPSGPEVVEGLVGMIERPAVLFSGDGLRWVAELGRMQEPRQLLSLLRKAGFQPHEDRLILFDPSFLVPFSRQEEALALCSDRNLLEERIRSRLRERGHAHPKEANHSEGPEKLRHLNMIQLLKVHTVLEALRNEDFVKTIVDELQRDLEDRASEHGGIVAFNDRGSLELRPFPSLAQGDNERYQPPREAIRSRKFSDFHMHARSEDEGIYAGPSDIMGGDLSVPLGYARRGLPYTALLFTKLPGKAFNADIYFGHPESPLSPVVVDLGNYSLP